MKTKKKMMTTTIPNPQGSRNKQERGFDRPRHCPTSVPSVIRSAIGSEGWNQTGVKGSKSTMFKSIEELESDRRNKNIFILPSSKHIYDSFVIVLAEYR